VLPGQTPEQNRDIFALGGREWTLDRTMKMLPLGWRRALRFEPSPLLVHFALDLMFDLGART
jgi:hypothetical protein